MSKLNTEEYTNYIDSAEMIIEYYKNQTATGLDKYFLEIEEWLKKTPEPNNNKPLIIEAEEGIGKKTLIIKWMEYHQANSKKVIRIQNPSANGNHCVFSSKYVKDLIIPNFAGTGGNNSNYFYAIYRILIKLRQHFEINQKVELLEEKLRKFFYYWLDVCSRTIYKQVVNDQNVILLFESINHYVDSETGNEAHVSMWLPKTFPPNIRVIATADSNSKAMAYFKDELGCDVIKIASEKFVTESQIQHHLSKPSFINNETYKQQVLKILDEKEAKNHSLFVKTYLATLLPYPSDNIVSMEDIDIEEFNQMYSKMDFERLKLISNIAELNDFLLDFYSENIATPEIFRNVMCYLTLTQKGLTDAELLLGSGITQKEWNKLVAVFKTFFMKYKIFWKINNETFKKAITNQYISNQSTRLKLHLDLAETLNKTSNSIRKLEEESYHLYCGESYFKLKEAISSIENFLLLFNPNNKYEFCRYWQRLEEKGFDPACEYNKAVESFDMHYRPNQQDSFRIILQISRFLKEFSDFETDYTPDFRHPPIRGGEELYDIGLLPEIVKLEMFMPENWELNKVGEQETLIVTIKKPRNKKNYLDYTKEMTREERDRAIKALIAQAREQIERNHVHLNDTGKTQEVTHKKALTLLGRPSILPQEPSNSVPIAKEKTEIKAPAKEEDESKTGEPARRPDINRLRTSQSAASLKVKPKYLTPQKKGVFDLYFETLNVEIAEHRTLVRMMYMLMGGLIEEGDINPSAVKKKSHFMLEDEASRHKLEGENAETEEPIATKRGFQAQREIMAMLLEKFQKTLDRGHDYQAVVSIRSRNTPAQERAPLYYYYKRWLWVMFPWACLSTGLYFSKIMEACFASETEYMSVKEEYDYTEQALRIAIEAKIKKKSVYAKNATNVSSASSKLLRTSMLIARKNLPEVRDQRRSVEGNRFIHRHRNLSLTQSRDDALHSVEKPKKKGVGLTLDVSTHAPVDARPFLSTKNQNQNQKHTDSHFFITSEFLNLSNLNNSASAQKTEIEPAGGFKSRLFKNDTSTQSSHLLNRSRDLKDRAYHKIFEREVDDVLKDRSLMTRDFEKRLATNTKTPAAQAMVNRFTRKNVNSSYLDVNASAILPKLTNSLTAYNEQSLLMTQKKVESMIKDFNETAHQNKQMAKQLKELNVRKMNLNTASEDSPVDLANKRIAELQVKVDEAQKLYEETKQEEMRLSTIINVCLRNKMENEAWIRDLSGLLQNVRKMYAWEKQTIEKCGLQTLEIRKVFIALYSRIHERINNHEKFVQYIKEELQVKEKIENKFNHIDDNLENSAMQVNEKLKEAFGKSKNLKEEKKKLLALEKNNKNIIETLETMEQDYEKVRPIVEESEEYSRSKKFKKFLDGLEKRNELEKSVFEQKSRVARLRAHLEEKKAYLAALKKAHQLSRNRQAPLDVTDETLEENFKNNRGIKEKLLEELRTSNQRKQLTILEAKVTLKTICHKLDINFVYDDKTVKSVPYEEIAEAFEQRIAFIRENFPQEKYEEILKGNFDMNQVLKEAFPPLDFGSMIHGDHDSEYLPDGNDE